MKPNIVTFLLLSVGTAFAQEADSLRPSTAVSIYADIEGAFVYVNGDSIGTTPILQHAIMPGIYHLRILPADIENWLSEPIIDSVRIEEGKPQTFSYSFSSKFLIISTPSGAEVISQDSILGTTPLIVKTPQRSIKLRKKGFEEIPVDFSTAKRGIINSRLKSVWQSEAEGSVLADSEEGGNSLRLYITGATTIVAGAASAYFKVRADNLYDQYSRTGDPGQLAEVNRLDTAAGIALAATQISLGLFTYFILSE